MISIKSEREIELMKETCLLAANTLQYIEGFVKEGISTGELNDLCHEYIIKQGATPSPLNYRGFPKSICTSINEVICHGIPSYDEILKDGDILNIDITTYYKNFHGDTNKTFLVGNVDPETKKLVDVAHQCMMTGIEVIKPGAFIGDIGAAVAKLAHHHHYSVVKEYCGHGIGREFHEEPQVVHNARKGTGAMMKPGMTFTVEPMINRGKLNSKVLSDGWRVVTRAGSLSAQFEHTILVTETGYEILTLLNNN